MLQKLLVARYGLRFSVRYRSACRSRHPCSRTVATGCQWIGLGTMANISTFRWQSLPYSARARSPYALCCHYIIIVLILQATVIPLLFRHLAPQTDIAVATILHYIEAYNVLASTIYSFSSARLPYPDTIRLIRSLTQPARVCAVPAFATTLC
ncbi:hypothetical protein EXIGLDRAFT_56757 [Exidia glandulosa HHB12029]|uniref:Uncharacterized protein n=1 Tax=Exidia glandulosa HHB12029 TaxID=1314781 RepID=A0A165I7Q7_EXIGL|nr:hypothetical protein EXIGLDRAFT_56757 [Exidia glandulosa HHB12029]